MKSLQIVFLLGVLVVLSSALKLSHTAQCSQATQQLCGSGYCVGYAFQNEQCQTCSQLYGKHCIHCDEENCLQSVTTHLVAAKDKCGSKQCQTKDCSSCSAKKNCTFCKMGFNLNQTQMSCKKSTCQIPFCLRCNGKSCAKCSAEYSPSSDGSKCNPICRDKNCNTCSSPTKCESCPQKWNLDQKTNKCVRNCSDSLITRCNQCVNAQVCLHCEHGYKLIYFGARCEPKNCVQDCYRCDAQNVTCIVCRMGYVPIQGAKRCIKAICIIQNCFECGSSTVCKKCAPGFGVTAEGQCQAICIKKVPFCQVCANETYCQTCIGGAVFNKNALEKGIQICQPICKIANCFRCNTTTTCLFCDWNQGLVPLNGGRQCGFNCFDPYCATCATTFNCTQCKEKYILNSQRICQRISVSSSVEIALAAGKKQTVPCSNSIPNCIECKAAGSAVSCKKCIDKYSLSATINKCLACSGLFPNCLLCTSVECKLCNADSRLHQGECIPCSVLNCLKCDCLSKTKCATCEPGFKLTNGKCIYNTTCQPGFVFQNGGCVCPIRSYIYFTFCPICYWDKCSVCFEHSCAVCQKGFYPVGGACSACMDHCERCDSDYACQACEFPYNFLNGTCQLLGDGFTGYQSSENQTLARCAIGCASCFVSDANTLICDAPLEGYSLKGNTIKKCSAYCKSCSSDDENLCLTCYELFTLAGGQCKKCTDPNADTCSSTNPAFALTCITGFTTVKLVGKCNACGQSCELCDVNGPGFCDDRRCFNGFTFDNVTKKCIPCGNNCPYCDHKDPKICLGCQIARFNSTKLQKSSCLGCPNDCNVCQNATTCTSCNPSHILVGSTCKPIPAYPILGYADDGISFICFQGFLLKNGKCILDHKCTAKKTCKGCVYGFFLNSGVCTKCTLGANCKSCFSATVKPNCELCNDGFYLDYGTCKKCGAGCLKCANDLYCNEAQKGFYIVLNADRFNSGAVAKCKAPCTTCIDNSKYCTSCPKGLSISGSTCVKTG